MNYDCCRSNTKYWRMLALAFIKLNRYAFGLNMASTLGDGGTIVKHRDARALPLIIWIQLAIQICFGILAERIHRNVRVTRPAGSATLAPQW